MTTSLVAATGSVAGKHPLDPRGWSGSSAALCLELQARGRLGGALGITAPPLLRAALLARSFHPDRARWRARLAFEPRFRAALTRRLQQRWRTGAEGDLLQSGAYFDGPAALAGRARAYAFHDGNLAVRLASPYPLAGVSDRRIAQALAFEQALARRTDRIFTMSAWLARSFVADYGADPARVHAIGGAINWAAPPPAQPGKDHARPVLVFVGADFQRKGGLVLLAAFRAVRSRFPRAVLHIAGPVRLPAASGPGVVHHGFLDKRALSALFREASLFVMPSLYEPFGIAPLEAMAHQLPAVVSGAWALAETVEDGVTGAHVPPGDADALAQILCGLLDEPERLAHMGLAARAAALSRFTWPAVVDRLEAKLA